ncbi:Stp1/IreP family PP2C-type Ser/Thr phosphatase [Mycetocola zhujimingii]|uniref:Stp1/IreP family PP2C-type Ser/Thr phosphatase n=1 Tax=Mycetocola zhujimingii TaxID=2079792 RepID=A0A2U1TAR4_9MICO|nr:Stp1/IreP family PP2C-type Ser/Thr phosphatase [Mycetocola zhujimingii]AWB85209.1 Stp1/IreP family PP2C-type Ser/Thr phosphatase [Mycetocola zhujimingii]PWC05989.1 Stp1/IreP family PP2C-type Ser/Thr phosphatase [Mycetocola zhujimingii]
MTKAGDSAAISHVGKIRSNNQDSGYAGKHLFVVADGMGGHAGGDVASAIALQRIIEADADYTSAQDAEAALQSAIISANNELADAVFEHPELAGMGTTVDAIVAVGDEIAIAHIGDSRIYLLRDGELSQITTDHTFVQRLVDSGRITEEEAMVHPRRSVLMRVLGDVDSNPEIDTMIMGTHPGDRWMLCSDGLSGVVDKDAIEATLAQELPARQVGEQLVRKALDGGAPDNVTVVIYDVGVERSANAQTPVIVGSASRPLAFQNEAPKRTGLLPSLRLHAARANPLASSHFEPASEDYLDELIEEDARRARRRRLTWLVGTIALGLAIVLAALLGYAWTQSRYFVGADDNTVVIYQGIQQDIGPFSLSHEHKDTGIPLSLLSTYDRQQVEQTLSAASLEEAEEIVSRLRTTTSKDEDGG